jgi:hypothetical protein
MHILTERGIDFGAYAAYLQTVRDRLPPHVLAFAGDPRHHWLDAPETLHDASLERLEVSESGTDDTRGVAVEVRLLGAFRDRAHVLRYSAVRRYEVGGAGAARGHGDLYAHEVRPAEDGAALVHEVRFVGPPGSGDSRLIVECADLRHATVELREAAG